MQLKPYPKGRFTAHLNTLYEDFRQKICQCGLYKRSYQAGEALLCQGQEVKQLYLVPEGRVSMNIAAINGRRFQLGEIKCDDHVFGEIEMFNGSPCQWTVIAEEAIDVNVICIKQVSDLLVKHPEFTLFFASALAYDYQDSLDIYTYRLLHPIVYNIAYDLWLRNQNHVLLGSFDKTSQEAERFGTSDRVYRRALKELVDKGLIEKGGGEIHITNPTALKAYIDTFE